MFRTTQAKEALDRKRKAGTAQFIGGDYDQVVSRIADFYLQRRDLLAAARSKKGITVSALTNADAAAISSAVRARLKARGEIGQDEVTYEAIDQRGERYDLAIAAGDKVAVLSSNDALAFGCVFGLSRAGAVWCPINPRNEAAENELHVENRGLLDLGLEATTLAEGLLKEVTEIAARYRDRCDLSKIPARSQWRTPHGEAAPTVRDDTERDDTVRDDQVPVA